MGRLPQHKFDLILKPRIPYPRCVTGAMTAMMVGMSVAVKEAVIVSPTPILHMLVLKCCNLWPPECIKRFQGSNLKLVASC